MSHSSLPSPKHDLRAVDSCPLPSASQAARRLFIEFLEGYLGIDGLFVGFQSTFGRGADLILFRSPKTGSTLAVECTVMLNARRENALEIVQQKIKANETEFAETNR